MNAPVADGEHRVVVVGIDDEADVHLARRGARVLATELGWSSSRIAELETAVSEVATNAWVHAGGGVVELTVEPGRSAPVIQVVTRDRGPGIRDVDRALHDGVSTAGTLGLGLSACTRLMDDVLIETEPGAGTTIWMWKAPGQQPGPQGGVGGGLSVIEVAEGPAATFGNLVWARASRAERSGAPCGDASLVKPTRFGEVVAVADGAGHGTAAATASSTALQVVANHAEQSPGEILERCHDALRRTVGASVSVVKVDALSDTLTWSGIGNVQFAIWSPGSGRTQARLAPRAGTLGRQAPPTSESTVEVRRGDVIVGWTDGIRETAPVDLDATVAPRELAADLLRHGVRPNDDALVLVAQYLGGTLR